MLVYAVASSETFQQRCFEQPGYQDQIALFFRGLQSNGVLLIDSDGYLLDEIETAIGSLSIKFRQELEIRMAEVRKSLRDKRRRRYILKGNPNSCNTSPTQSPLQQCTKVALATSPDSVFLSEDEIELVNANGTRLPISRMNEYSRGEFEGRRRRYMEDLPPIDQLDASEFDDLIVRATKFSTWLRFYDKQIGKGQSVSNFRRGIERILQLWISNAHFSPQLVEIVTAEAESLSETESDFAKQRKQERIRECSKKVHEILLNPLKAQFSLEFRLSIKQDPHRIFHARHLQTQTANLLVDRGFDMQNDDGSFKRNIIKLDNGAQEHLDECRALKEGSEC